MLLNSVDVKAGQRTVHSHYRLRDMNVPWISTPSLTCDVPATSATTPLSLHVTIPTIHGKVVESTVLRPTTHPSNFQQVWKMLRASSGYELRRGVTLTLGMCTKCAHSIPLYRDRQSFAVLWQRTTSSAGGPLRCCFSSMLRGQRRGNHASGYIWVGVLVHISLYRQGWSFAVL